MTTIPTVADSAALVLHEVGDRSGGSPWSDAFAAHEWAKVLAPDMPGHGDAPAPSGNNYGLTDPMFIVTRLFAAAGIEKVDLVVGIGVSGWSAKLLALAGKAERLVLVNGLGDPFLTMDELLDRRMARVRTIADSDDPLTDAPPTTHGDRELAERAAKELELPVLLIGADNATHREFVDIFPNAVLQFLDHHDPHVIAEIVAEWTTTT